MEIWLDTTKIEIIKKAEQLGILSGVTTNPLILSQSKKDDVKMLQEILKAQSGPVTAQVTCDDCEGMIEQAHFFQSISKRIIIKIPVTVEGLKAIHQLSRQYIQVMATVVFNPNQALLAALAGAHYVAPYLGRIESTGADAFAMLQSMMRIFSNYRLETKILVASIKNSDQVRECAEMGVHAVTLKDDVFSQLIENNVHTLQALEKFAEASIR